MRNILLLLITFVGFSVHGQVSLTKNDLLPSVGDTFIIKSTPNPISISLPTGVGSNLIWDYSSAIGFNSSQDIVFYDVNSVAGLSALYPSAEFVISTSVDLIYSLYSYSNGMEYWGYYDANDTIICSTPYKFTNFPIDNSLNVIAPFSSNFSNGIRDLDYIGDGYLVLPNGNIYSNSILVKTRHVEAGNSHDEYHWYVAGSPIPLMSIYDYGTSKLANYLDNVPTVIVNVPLVEEQENAITIYPIPASDIINIESDKTIETIVIRNIGGKRIRNISMPNETRIDIRELPKGIYSCEIHTKQEISTKQFIKQ